ncbi:hypothetical protein [Oharaeibacter diazotrophicus]|uniref:Nickel-dependent hydrogenase n=1 Tax=Oharaeibacter diazotrophicus TaxID=1920512 RepID=A0A4R6RK90_9HYPH|nr:hypothetical protein [Oharaeibacter diazotrophicus]TDP86973.1 hypothetical protein EDD54_0858 [Oharaeibacter diazotrophicus]BBE71084.1 hypothetical protein OHA_1_00654 [Pleomorphomonas sp. SM30]GLS77835.1 hydrogenase expression/formation protein HupK [Oharaeibacter diazotrophicus]
MNAPLRPGGLAIVVRLDAGRVAAVTVTGERPRSLLSTMAGRPVEAAETAVRLLHGLCGASHAAGVRFAAAVAAGRELDGDDAAAWTRRLAGERLAESVRALVPVDAALLTDPDRAGALRAVVAHGAAIARTGAVDPVSRGAIEAGLVRLGLDGREAAPAPVAGADVLTAADDAAVVEALAGDPDFVARPVLPGRRPETGPAARAGASAADPEAARAARRAEVAAAFALLAADRVPGPTEAGWVAAAGLGAGWGFAAVESPRGRLHTLLTVHGDGRLRSARVLAPTEWNFHPDGPFARSLIGLRPAGDPAAEVARRAAAYDPCVAFDVAVGEDGDA